MGQKNPKHADDKASLQFTLISISAVIVHINK